MHLHLLFAVTSLLPMAFAAPSLDHTLSKRTEPYCPPRPVSEKCQRDIFAEFVDELYIQKNATKAFLAHVNIGLIEHEPYDQQGRTWQIGNLGSIIPFVNFQILRHNMDANIGFIHLKINVLPQPAALADIYRMNGTCIVEHWGVVQVRPANATNPIAMF